MDTCPFCGIGLEGEQNWCENCGKPLFARNEPLKMAKLIYVPRPPDLPPPLPREISHRPARRSYLRKMATIAALVGVALVVMLILMNVAIH